MKKPWEPCWWCNRLWYLPIVFILIAGYLAGGYLTFFVKFLGALPQVKEEDARFTIVLYGMGVLGATLYASYFFAKDANQVMYKDDARCPNFLDFLGYGILIGGGGITGLVLYIVAKTGTFLIYTQPEATEIRFSTSLLIALAGGMATQKVKGYLLSFAENVIKNTKNDQDGEQGRGGNG